jgi:uncharacterized Tic20 family protein
VYLERFFDPIVCLFVLSRCLLACLTTDGIGSIGVFQERTGKSMLTLCLVSVLSSVLVVVSTMNKERG